MRENAKRFLISGIIFIAAFALWTMLIQLIDVQPLGPNGTYIGFAEFNFWFHKWTGVHMKMYTITDWLGLVPAFICIIFGGVGFVQLFKRRSLFKVERDLIILGIYYVIVILAYINFEIHPINYRPILIEGLMEASYPSSTVLLVLSVMTALIEQVNRRVKNAEAKRIIGFLAVSFSVFMVIGRLISGVHWFTDILGAALLSAGLFFIYKAVVILCLKKESE